MVASRLTDDTKLVAFYAAFTARYAHLVLNTWHYSWTYQPGVVPGSSMDVDWEASPWGGGRAGVTDSLRSPSDWPLTGWIVRLSRVDVELAAVRVIARREPLPWENLRTEQGETETHLYHEGKLTSESNTCGYTSFFGGYLANFCLSLRRLEAFPSLVLN